LISCIASDTSVRSDLIFIILLYRNIIKKIEKLF